MKSVICPYLRLTAKTETQFLRNCSQFQAACKKKFLAYLRNNICLNVFELKAQAALELFNLSAIVLIMFTVSKRISLSADSDQMVPPSVDLLNFLPLYLKARTFRFGGSPLISYQFISAAPNEYYKNILIFKGDNI